MGSSILTVLILVSSFSYLASADMASTINDQKEQGLETDTATMEIKDLETEQKLAREQTRAQEQMAKGTAARLHKVENQKAELAEKTKVDIAFLEKRRIAAEKSTAESNKQIRLLQGQIKVLDNKRLAAQKAAQDAEGVSTAGRDTVNSLHSQRTDLENQNRQALADQARAEAELAQLKQESIRLGADIKSLETRLQINRDTAQKRKALIPPTQKKISQLKSREQFLKTALVAQSKEIRTVAKNPVCQPLLGDNCAGE